MSTMNKSQGHSKKTVFAPYVKDENGRLVKASENEVRTPELSCWKGWNRLQPMTAIVTGTPIQSQEVDFQYGSNLARGYCQEIFIEITVKEGNTGPSIFHPTNLWQRIDVVDSHGKIYRNLYTDEMYVVPLIHRDLLQHQRFRKPEGLQLDYTPESPTVAQNSSRQFILSLPLFDDLIDLRLLNKPLMFRFYFNNFSSVVMSASSANVSISSFNLLVKEIQIPSQKFSKPIHHRYQNYTRLTRSIAMQANNFYDIKLDTFSGYSAFIFFMLRPNGTNTNADNLYNYTPLSYVNLFEMRDSTNNIIGINNNLLENKYITTSDFNSDFLIQPNTHIGIISFSMAGQQAQNGWYSGSYQFTTNEILHLEMNGSLPTATYELTVWSSEYNWYGITPDGSFFFTR
jgi:hypothetical protein